MKKTHALLPLLMAPAVAFAFETVDTLPWPSLGRFPAYPREEVRPTDFWVQGGVMRDDNILRLENGEQSDTVSRVGIGISHEQRILGRQSLRLEGRADHYKFDKFGDLDHLAYLLDGRWLWEVGNRLSGTVGVSQERRLADLAELRVPVRDLLTTSRLFATGAYLLTPSIRLRAGATAADGDSEVRRENDTSSTAVSVGADYVSGLGNSIGIEYRKAKGDAPTDELIDPLGIFVNNDYDESEAAIVVSYALGSRLRADGRIGHTEREYSQVPGRNFSGTTGRARVEWFPGNKTSLIFDIYREPRSILDIAASHVLVEGVGIGPNWAPTPKLVFSGRLLFEDRVYDGDPLLTVGGFLRKDEVQTLRLGVGWEPLRHWQFGFALDWGDRDSNVPGFSYDFTAFTANVAWRY